MTKEDTIQSIIKHLADLEVLGSMLWLDERYGTNIEFTTSALAYRHRISQLSELASSVRKCELSGLELADSSLARISAKVGQLLEDDAGTGRELILAVNELSSIEVFQT